MGLRAWATSIETQIDWLRSGNSLPYHFTKRALEKEEYLLVCDAARELTAAKYALLAVEGRGEVGGSQFTTSGLEAQTVARIGYPRWSDGAVRTALAEGKALRLTNPGGQSTAVGLPALYLPVHSLLVAVAIATLAIALPAWRDARRITVARARVIERRTGGPWWGGRGCG